MPLSSLLPALVPQHPNAFRMPRLLEPFFLSEIFEKKVR